MREFDPAEHLRTFEKCPRVQLRDGRGSELSGVTGRSGPQARGFSGQAIGLDEINMEPGTRFELHEHEGDHILYVLEGQGGIFVEGVLHQLSVGDSVFVPAETPHGVSTVEGATGPFRFLAFGVPHHPLDDDDRMHLIDLQEA